MREAVLRRYVACWMKESLCRSDYDRRRPVSLNAAGDAMRELDLEAVPMVGVVKPPLKHNQVSYLLVKGREHQPIFSRSAS